MTRRFTRSFFCSAALLSVGLIRLTLASPQQPLRITLMAVPNVLKTGSEARLQIILTNTSGESIPISSAMDGTAPVISGSLVEVFVLDEKGNSPPETKYQRHLRGEEPPEGYVTSGILRNLLQAATSKESLVVNKFYDLSKPGKYKICLQWTDPTSKTVVKSNTITVTVTP